MLAGLGRLRSYRFRREPVVWVAALKAILYAALLFRPRITLEQFGAIWAAMETLSAVIVRRSVFAPTSRDGDRLEAVKYEGQAIQSVKSAEAA
jgi:hypothetical protein